MSHMDEENDNYPPSQLEYERERTPLPVIPKSSKSELTTKEMPMQFPTLDEEEWDDFEEVGWSWARGYGNPGRPDDIGFQLM